MAHLYPLSVVRLSAEILMKTESDAGARSTLESTAWSETMSAATPATHTHTQAQQKCTHGIGRC